MLTVLVLAFTSAAEPVQEPARGSANTRQRFAATDRHTVRNSDEVDFLGTQDVERQRREEEERRRREEEARRAEEQRRLEEQRRREEEEYILRLRRELEERAKEVKGPKITAVAIWRNAEKAPHTIVIRTADEAAVALGAAPDKARDEATRREATSRFAKDLKVDGIDWTKQMVVVVAAGRKNTGGFSVEFTGLEIKNKTLTVKWKLHTPQPGGTVTQVITHPGTAALVGRFDGDVKFDPLPKPKGEDK
jgi:hypothetical protein